MQGMESLPFLYERVVYGGTADELAFLIASRIKSASA